MWPNVCYTARQHLIEYLILATDRFEHFAGMPDTLWSGIFVATGRLLFVERVRCWQAKGAWNFCSQAQAGQKNTPGNGQLKTPRGAILP